LTVSYAYDALLSLGPKSGRVYQLKVNIP
jgi:hypothetical protein